MSEFYCVSCGQYLFKSSDILGQQLLLEVPGYSCECYNLKESTDLSHLRHRNDDFLTEAWSCCRINIVRANRGGASTLNAYTDSLVELPEGSAPPVPAPLYKPRELTEKDFDQVIFTEGAEAENAATLYVVKFSALWCPPCRIMDQVIRDIASSSSLPEVQFFEVDSDVEQDLTDRFLAPSVPYIVFFKAGKRLDASRFTLKSVNGGIAEAMNREEFSALCRSLVQSNG